MMLQAADYRLQTFTLMPIPIYAYIQTTGTHAYIPIQEAYRALQAH
jgi:hypothetical protein